MNNLKISDFSIYPGGRFRSEGPNSGEEYREQVFDPTVAKGLPVTVDLRNLEILLPSFVDEAFGPYCQNIGGKKFREMITFIYPHPESEAEFFVKQMIAKRSKNKAE